MTQLAISRPLGELDLGDELGARPVRRFVGFRALAERTLARFERLQQLHQPAQLLLVETRAGVTRIDETRGPGCGPRFVDAEQQRAEVDARLSRLGPAAD